MNIVIAGAGELGQLLAEKLSANSHDVVLIDTSAETLDQVSDSLDIRLVEGSCISLETLKRANITQADAMLAVSGDDATNVLACQLSAHFGVKKTICRINKQDLFSKENHISPQTFGIWKYISPPEACVRKITAILENPCLMEEIRFTHPDAIMRVLEITNSSILAGTRLKDIPLDSSMIAQVRFAALIREKKFIIPHGDTLFVPGDKVYIAGTSDNVKEFIHWTNSEQEIQESSRVIIAGATVTGTLLAQELCRTGYDVRIIEKNRQDAEKLSDAVPSNVLVINGTATDEEVQMEAGIQHCSAFISAALDDEENILSCLIAKRLGAAKTISVTSKPEYIRMVPTMDLIDCGISSTLAAVNAILRQLETGTMRVDAYLQMYHAQLTEFRVSNSSPLCGKSLAASKLPVSTLFALLFRGNEVIAPAGNTVFQPGDVVVAIVTPESEKEIEPLFPDC